MFLLSKIVKLFTKLVSPETKQALNHDVMFPLCAVYIEGFKIMMLFNVNCNSIHKLN